MSTIFTHPAEKPVRRPGSEVLRTLVGAGDRIGRFVLPFLAAGLALNLMRPELFSVGGPPAVVRGVAFAVLVPGVVIWAWSVALILSRVPCGELITGGPYALVKHPLYTSVGLLVLPAAGLLLDSWLGIALGAVLYIAARRYAPAEEAALAHTFGAAWDDYRERVLVTWL